MADPPYGETSLTWDRRAAGWLPHILDRLKDSGSLWCFGSLRFFMASGREFDGWSFIQDVIWEKHNGSNFTADRFRRVHEIAAQFQKAGVPWSAIYRQPVYTLDATARTVRTRGQTPHTGKVGSASNYRTVDGGPRLARSVIKARSCNGYAIHPTQKPEGIVSPLIEYACPPDGLVLSPFMGSGTDLVVARTLGRRAIGIEIEERYCEIAARRLEDPPLLAAVKAEQLTLEDAS